MVRWQLGKVDAQWITAAHPAPKCESEMLALYVQDTDRIESGKAAAVAGAAGTLAALPFVLSDQGSGLAGVLTLGGVALSCLLFGLVYRYALRQDLANIQLKSGVVAAFGLVRGVAQGTDVLLAAGGEGASDFGAMLSALPSAALLAGESMLMFAFASAAVEFAFSQGLVKPRQSEAQ